jgi:hypothetical protein
MTGGEAAEAELQKWLQAAGTNYRFPPNVCFSQTQQIYPCFIPNSNITDNIS